MRGWFCWREDESEDSTNPNSFCLSISRFAEPREFSQRRGKRKRALHRVFPSYWNLATEIWLVIAARLTLENPMRQCASLSAGINWYTGHTLPEHLGPRELCWVGGSYYSNRYPSSNIHLGQECNHCCGRWEPLDWRSYSLTSRRIATWTDLEISCLYRSKLCSMKFSTLKDLKQFRHWFRCRCILHALCDVWPTRLCSKNLSD